MRYPRSFPLALLCAGLLLSASLSTHAKDEWLQVRSKNFFLVGNASEKDIRKVGVKLEEFRETFRLLFSSVSLTSPVPTNVVVFKSDSAFKPFKPRRNDGKADTFVAGYFQGGEDANYIAVSADGNDDEMYNTIFHEYVHFIVDTNFGKSEVPPWFNEGLAEYYSTFAIVDDQKVKLGLPQSSHIYLLQQTRLMPLDQLFKISNRQLLAQGGHSRSIIYAESWALIHYLILGGKGAGLDKFLGAVLRGVPQDKAFQDAFQMTYAQMEAELKKYVGKSTYQYVDITLKNKLDFDSQMQVSPYPESDASARLGDLLYHNNRADDAEPFLINALKLDPDLSMANTTMGMVKMRQRKFDEAKQYLEKATAGEQKNHLAFYQYAYLLSREGRDDLGFVRGISKETAEKIRAALKRAIAIAPDFGESYDLLAFVALVSNDGVDEAIVSLQNALKLQPGNERYAMRIAELLLRQEKFDQAAAIAAKFSQSDNDDVRSRAETLMSAINSRKELEQRIAGLRRSARTTDGADAPNKVSDVQTSQPLLRKREPVEKPMTDEEFAKASEEANIRSINEALRASQSGEKRVLGYVDKIECKGAAITYLIKASDGVIALTSKDFQGLEVNSFTADGGNINIGCGEDLSALLAVVTFKEPPAQKLGGKGDLVSVEFVPKTFRLMSRQEIEARIAPKTAPDATLSEKDEPPVTSSPIMVSTTGSGPPPDFEKAVRDNIMRNIRSAIRQPGPGEKREMAFLQKVECKGKDVFFNMKTTSAVLRLLSPNTEALPIRVFAPDLGGVSLECNTSIMDFPAVVTYSETADKKRKSAGTIVSLDFVPKNFTLE
jgi:tetratricopeptide (TPR) repeat protein